MDKRVIKAARSLMMRYQTISIIEIENALKVDPNLTIRAIPYLFIKIGTPNHCRLCVAATRVVGKDICQLDKYRMCIACIYNKPFNTNNRLECITQDTYKAIRNASTTSELIVAFRNRAKFIRSILNKIKVDGNS